MGFLNRLLLATCTVALHSRVQSFSLLNSPPSARVSLTQLHSEQSTYYGQQSFVVNEFSLYEELQDVVQLSAAPLPERPDGIVCVAKYTSAERDDCRSTEADYERLARANPATVFMRCYAEYENAHIVVSQADVTVWPTYDVFYQGRRVGRVEGNRITDVEELIDMHQFLNSKLDLFSEDADNAKRLAWGEGKIASAMKTPRTTNRFIIGYDWDKDNSFFDDTAQKFEEDFTKMFGEWTPNIEE